MQQVADKIKPRIGGEISRRNGKHPVISIFTHRSLIKTMVTRNMKSKYKASVLGIFWSFLNPLLLMTVYSVIFSIYLKIGVEGYPVFFLSGFVAWLWFSESVTNGTSSILTGSAYIKSAVIPSELLPVVEVCSSFMNFLTNVLLLLVFAALFRWRIGLSLLIFPFLILGQALITLGLVFITATFNVFLRDLTHIISNLLMLFFFILPITYPISTVPLLMKRVYEFFPMSILIEGYHAVFYYGTWPDWRYLLFFLLFSLIFFIFGATIFKNHKDSFVEFI
jgi:lipopolysaccharide transport system permease protein